MAELLTLPFLKGGIMTLKEKELNILLKEELKFIEKKPSQFLKKEKDFLNSFIEHKTPEKIQITTEAVFQSAFEFIFEEGIDIIEKTYSKYKLQNEYENNKKEFNLKRNEKALKKFDKSVKTSNNISAFLTGVKSTALGTLGVGLPDIPIFVAEIIRVVYSTALKYGYSYENENEKIFILSIIAFALCETSQKQKYSGICDNIAECIETEKNISISLKDMEYETSQILSKTVCGTKLIQGVMIAGILSSAGNISIINNVSKSAYLKYKKRFIMYKLVNKK